MPNTYQIGRVGRVYVAKQSAYGTAPTFAATDAVRHLDVKLNANPRNRVNAPDRNTHPSLLARRTRRTTADWSLGGIFFPSGTINTLPDHADILECGLGAVNNTTLATTFSGSPTTTTGTVASATGLAAGRAILISIAAGVNAGKYVRWLTAATSGTALVWAPALPAAPLSGDSCKGCITYSLATALPNALEIGHYLTSVSKEGAGCVVDELQLMIDANDEVRWTASGPMAERLTAAQADPATFTVVGSTPPSGLTGTLRVGAAAYEFLKLGVTVKNAMELDNFAAGTTKAQAYYRNGVRSIEVDINAMYSSDVTLMTAAEGTTDTVLLAQVGQTEGSIIALYAPAVEFDVPDDPNADETMEHSFKGVAKGSSGNDEFYLAVA
jgi:hypothetical protein